MLKLNLFKKKSPEDIFKQYYPLLKKTDPIQPKRDQSFHKLCSTQDNEEKGHGFHTYHDQLTSAIKSNDMTTIKRMIETEIGVNNLSYWTSGALRGDNRSPLHYTAEYGKMEVMKYLVEIGEIVNVYNSEQQTPLMNCSEKGNFEGVKYLCEKGGDVDLKDKRKQSALMLAAKKGHEKVVKYLISKGGKINEKDDRGYDSLLVATRWGKIKVVKVLIEAGADINVLDMNKNTPLHISVKWGKVDVVKYLLSKKARTDMKNDKGKTAVESTRKNEIKSLFK